MFVCYDSDILFYTGLSIGLWIASVVGMGCAMLSFRKKSYADQIEEMMFEHIVQQLRGINMAEAFEEEEQEEQVESDSEEQVDSDSEEQVESDSEEQEQESEESNDADNEEEQEQEQEQEQDIEYVEETQTEDLPDLVEEPAPVESSETSDDAAPPSKRARRGRGRGRGRNHT